MRAFDLSLFDFSRTRELIEAGRRAMGASSPPPGGPFFERGAR